MTPFLSQLKKRPHVDREIFYKRSFEVLFATHGRISNFKTSMIGHSICKKISHFHYNIKVINVKDLLRNSAAKNLELKRLSVELPQIDTTPISVNMVKLLKDGLTLEEETYPNDENSDDRNFLKNERLV